MADSSPQIPRTCDHVLALLKECLLRSDCVLKHNELPSKCLKEHFEELPMECKLLRNAHYECKRGLVSTSHLALIGHGQTLTFPFLISASNSDVSINARLFPGFDFFSSTCGSGFAEITSPTTCHCKTVMKWMRRINPRFNVTSLDSTLLMQSSGRLSFRRHAALTGPALLGAIVFQDRNLPIGSIGMSDLRSCLVHSVRRASVSTAVDRSMPMSSVSQRQIACLR